MNALIPNEIGTWVECCNAFCKKWRYSVDYDDPLTVPNKWYCNMNSDESANTCTAPECQELEEGEIFIESRFKAGCIVWAKIIGHPWSLAMIDFCPEFECYYWFEKDNTNVPSQYHVTFFNGKQVTRGWVKDAFIKPFVGNKDPSFALRSRVRNKKLTARQRADIIKGCEIGEAALLLTISQRLKKYNFNSWRLAQRFQNQFANSGTRTAPRAAGQSSKGISNHGVGPSNTKKATTMNKISTKKSPVNEQFINTVHKDLEKSVPSNTKRSTRAAANELALGNVLQKTTSRPKNPVFVVSMNHDDPQNDTATSVETPSINIKGMDDTPELEDTRSINSYDLSELLDASVTKEKVSAVEKRGDALRLDGGPALDILTDKRLSEKEIVEIVNEALDEIIPCSQPSTPSSKYQSNKIMRKYKNADNISKEKQPREDSDVETVSETLNEIIPCSQPSTPSSKYQSNRIVRKYENTDNISNKKQPQENSGVEIVNETLNEIIPSSQPSTPSSEHPFIKILNQYKDDIIEKIQPTEDADVEFVTEEFEAAVRSPRISRLGELSLKFKSIMEEKRRKFTLAEHKLASENLIRTENEVNTPNDSKYRRALSEFTSKGQNALSDATNYQPRKIPLHKPLPSWFTDEEKKRKAKANRLSRLSKLSDEEDNRMYKENREKFITEMASAGVGPSREGNGPDIKQPNYLLDTQNYAHLMTSDEDSL